MKILIIILSIFQSTTGFSQIEPEDSTAIEEDGEIMEISGSGCDPKYPGGDAAMMKFVSDSTVYPKLAIELGVEGIVYVQFVVDSTGVLQDIEAVHGPDLLIEPALNVVMAMPKWEPAYCHGEFRRVRYTAPIHFNLH